MAEILEPGTNEVRRRDQLDKQASRKYTREEDRTAVRGFEISCDFSWPVRHHGMARKVNGHATVLLPFDRADSSQNPVVQGINEIRPLRSWNVSKDDIETRLQGYP